VVNDEERLRKRVTFIHDSLGTDAIAEQYIDGRELYVGLLGNDKVRVFPVWEMHFQKMVEGDNWPIATERVKWNVRYQQKHGIRTDQAQDLPPAVADQIGRMCKRIYRALELTAYARIDLRMDASGRVHFIEANPNPQLAIGEDFAESASRAGIPYPALLDRILALGLAWRPGRT
jgi:D-alanine-D-alanine ligase